MKNLHVLGFSGSLRKGSFNTALLRAAAELLPEGVALEVFDLSPIPLYNSDVETAGVPEAVQNFKARLAAADALLIATPEYNYSNMLPLNKPEVYVTRAAEKFDAQGRLFDEPTRQRLRELSAALRDWTHRLRGESKN